MQAKTIETNQLGSHISIPILVPFLPIQLGEFGCWENSTYYPQMDANTHKGANGIILQKDYKSFLAIFTFSYERISNENFATYY
jgi:hypothetical protein